MSFGANLEKLRRRMGIQIYQLENYCGIPRQRLSELEAEKTSPTLTEVLALSYVFSTTPQELLDMVDKKNVNQAVQGPKSPRTEVPNSNVAQAPKMQTQTPNIQAQVQNKQTGAQNVQAQVKAGKKETAKPTQTTKKETAKRTPQKNADWKADDVAEALQQLQAVDAKEPGTQSAKRMDASQLQRQAIAHVANSGKTNVQKESTPETKQVKKPITTQKNQSVQNNEKSSTHVSTKEFGMKMSEARRKLNLSYPKICKELGIETIKYIQIEAGMVQPSADLKAKICKLFGID